MSQINNKKKTAIKTTLFIGTTVIFLLAFLIALLYLYSMFYPMNALWGLSLYALIYGAIVTFIFVRKRIKLAIIIITALVVTWGEVGGKTNLLRHISEMRVVAVKQL